MALNENLLYSEVDRLVARQLHVNGLESRPARHTTILKYAESWMNGTSVQKAPQETDVGMYLSSSMLSNDLAGLQL